MVPETANVTLEPGRQAAHQFLQAGMNVHLYTTGCDQSGHARGDRVITHENRTVVF